MDCALSLRCKSLYITILARFLSRRLPTDTADGAEIMRTGVSRGRSKNAADHEVVEPVGRVGEALLDNPLVGASFAGF